MTKKRILLLVSLFLVFGLASALAQTQWTTGANENDYGRDEGLSEATGAVSLTTGSSGTVGTGTYFKITYTSPITDLGTLYIVCSGSSSPQSPLGAGGPWAGAGCNGLFSAILTNSNKTLVITWLDSVAFPTGANTQISITVRLNVAGAPCGGEAAGGQTAVVDAHTPALQPNLTITPNQPSLPLRVMVVNCEPALSVGFGYYYTHLSSEADVIICLGVIKSDGEYANHFVLNIDEEFIHALTSESYEMELDPGSGGGDVTNGSNISITFTGIPNGFGIKAEDPIPCTSTTGTPLYCAGGTLAVSLTGTDYFEGSAGNSTWTVEYVVTMVDNGDITQLPENVNLPFKIWSEAPVSNVALSQIYATVTKDPNPTTDPGCFSPTPHCIPRFIYMVEGSGSPLSVVEFDNCLTNLLWPFVTVSGAWDSAIAIANTSSDQLATNLMGSGGVYNPLLAAGSAVPQNGACTLSVYSAGSLVLEFASPTIVSGSVWGTDLLAVVPNLNGNGYIFATCFFANAKGYGYITNNIGAPNGVFGNYLAYVIPDPEFVPRWKNGWGLGEGADTPLNINSQILELLFKGIKHH